MAHPTAKPTAKKTEKPSAQYTDVPTSQPTVHPTAKPTAQPTLSPTISMKPSATPTLAPTAYNCSSPFGRSSDIKTVVSSISTSVIPGSPQAQALSWLLINDTATNACNGSDQISQRYSLTVFFYSTMGPDWNHTALWLGPEDECSWFGVRCTNNGFVTSLELGT